MASSTRLAPIATAGALKDSAAREGPRVPGTRSTAGGGYDPELMAASALEGETVLDTRGETLGEIEEIMLDVQSGRIRYAVLAVGGFLGIGEKYFPVPWAALTLDTDRQCFVLDLDRDRLADAPGFDKDNLPWSADRDWAAKLHAFYGTEPDSR